MNNKKIVRKKLNNYIRTNSRDQAQVTCSIKNKR